MKFLKVVKVLLLIIICSFLIHNISACVANGDEEVNNDSIYITLEKAKEKGKEELKTRGYPIENMSITADEENTSWQKFIVKNPSILQREIVKRMNLEQKNYWVIYYAPKEEMLGGDAWVFVDVITGNIIGVILGE